MENEKTDHRGIQKPRGSETKGTDAHDLFLNTLWDVLHKEASFTKTQPPRFRKLWSEILVDLEPNPHQVREFRPKKDAFFENDENKVEMLKQLEISLIDGYYCVKSVVATIFARYFPDSEKFFADFGEADREPLMFRTSEVLIGSLLQFLSTEREILPLKFLVIAKNKSMLRLKGRSDEKILENLRANGFESDVETIQEIMDEMVQSGFVEKRDLTPEEKNKGIQGSFYYTWNKEKDFNLSPEGEKFFKIKILPLLEWTISLWRSMYNIRELDVEILDSYKWKSYLENSVKKAATQGFMTCYWVIKNIRKYYEMIVNDRKGQITN